MTYRTSLITAFDGAELEEGVSNDLNFAAATWDAEVVTIKFSTTSHDEGEGHYYAALIIYRINNTEAAS